MLPCFYLWDKTITRVFERIKYQMIKEKYSLRRFVLAIFITKVQLFQEFGNLSSDD